MKLDKYIEQLKNIANQYQTNDIIISEFKKLIKIVELLDILLADIKTAKFMKTYFAYRDTIEQIIEGEKW